jgi:hypothetical protein
VGVELGLFVGLIKRSIRCDADLALTEEEMAVKIGDWDE